MRPRRPVRRCLALFLAGLLALSACSDGNGDRAAGGRPSQDDGADMTAVGLESASLSAGGRELAAGAGSDQWPQYRLDATIDPGTGAVETAMAAELPAPVDGGPLTFRVFPNLPAFASGFELRDLTVNGESVEPELDRSLLTVPVARLGAGGRIDVAMRFSYTVPVTDLDVDLLAGLAGTALDPAEIGLLGRHDGGLSLGHWFPVWLQPGTPAVPEPEGFGDIGNFPAARFSARIDVPSGWHVFSGGTTTDRQEEDGRVTFEEEGMGLRDLALYAGRDVATSEVEVDGVTVRVVSRSGDPQVLDEVAGEAAGALDVLAEAFGPYPWSELDVIDVPLGSGVGGMEWPGAIWIESATFGGGIPGLAGLEDLFGGEDGLGALLGGQALATLREFVVAHEVAHQWWHALVGNDSITAPVVDEPLAQFSACHYLRTRYPEGGDDMCAFHTEGQYQSLRALGQPDAPADQPSDAFSSSLQYGAVIYGKAPGFYEDLSERFGAGAVLAGLRSYVDAHPFAIANPEDLRAALSEAVPGRAQEVEALWVRWMEETHGDEDLGAGPAGGLLGQLEGLEGLDGLEGLEGLESGDLGQLQQLLAQLLEGLGQ